VGDNMRLEEILESTMKEQNKIGENTFLKLRQQRDQARAECDQVKIQRDVALRKLNKALQIAKDLRKLIENGNQTK
jgi:LPS O-antigen subunit length determinant protein (WzzB/FepE family)